MIVVDLYFYVQDKKNTKSEIQQYTTNYQVTMDSDEDDSDIISCSNNNSQHVNNNNSTTPTIIPPLSAEIPHPSSSRWRGDARVASELARATRRPRMLN